jgi:carbon monoxide dehydrogenase subunit G
MEQTNAKTARSDFERSIQALDTQIASTGVHLTIDSSVRRVYAQEVRRMADALRAEALSGRITWATAAERAQQARNVVMEIVRGRSTPVGNALATRVKAEGATLNEVLARQTIRLYGEKAVFSSLSEFQQRAVYAKVVASAGKSNPAVTAAMVKIGHFGRGLLIVSVAISVYNVATAEDKVRSAERELVVTGAGIGGGIASGALAGLACGPGAPVCVTVGAFVGGALAAFGVGLYW